ncbi:MAG: 5-carboxymethyl-2-hydroxymuconate Delta-isomerase [Chloroflexota bacterium]
MPHLTLEYTGNIKQEIDSEAVFSHLHQILATTGGIKIDNCKSRAVRMEDYFIARGGPAKAFVHLEIHFLEGRSEKIKQAIGKESLEVLKAYFASSIEKLDLQINVEITEIRRSAYHKFPSGTLK